MIIFEQPFPQSHIHQLITQATPSFRPIHAIDDHGNKVIDKGRDSHTAFLSHTDTTSLSGKLAHQVAILAGFPSREYVEQIEVNRYEKGQRFSIHYDFLSEKGVNDDSHFSGCQRVATALLYLTTVPKGGETVFARDPTFKGGFDDIRAEHPDHAKIKPVTGRMVLWYNVHPFTEMEDKRTWHGGAPVEDGVKMAATFYIRNCSIVENRARVEMMRKLRDWKPNISVAVEKGADRKNSDEDGEDDDDDEDYGDEELDEEEQELLKELEQDEKNLNDEDREFLQELRERRDRAEKMNREEEEEEFDDEDLELLRELEAQDEKDMDASDREILEDLREAKRKHDAKMAAKFAKVGEDKGNDVKQDSGMKAGAVWEKSGTDGEREVKQFDLEDGGTAKEEEGGGKSGEESKINAKQRDEVDEEGDEHDEDEDEDDEDADEDDEDADEDDEDEDEDDEDEDEDGEEEDANVDDSQWPGFDDIAKHEGKYESQGAGGFDVSDDFMDDEDWLDDDYEEFMQEQNDGQCGGGAEEPADFLYSDQISDDAQCGGASEPFGNEGFGFPQDFSDGAWEEFDMEDDDDDEEFIPMDGGGKVIPPMEPIDDLDEPEKEEL